MGSKGLPQNLDAEKFILGAILMDGSLYGKISPTLAINDFSLQRHQRIFRRMGDVKERGEEIDRITVANELMKFGELEADGLSYLISLDDGMPEKPHVENYVTVVREKSALRRLVFLGQKLMATAGSQEHPVSRLLNDLSKSVTSIQIRMGRKSSFQNPAQIIDEYGGVVSFIDGAIDPGISFGYPQIDELLLGLQPDCQYIFAGRTSSGKSSLAMNVAVSLAKRGVPVAILSLEMTKEVLLARAICGEAHVPLKPYLKRDLMPDQRHAIADGVHTISELPIYIDDSAGMTISDMVEKVDRAVEEYKVRVFILDHLSRINWQGDQHLKLRDEYNGMTTASWTACMLARKHHLSSIVLCQLNRPEKRKESAPPNLSDLRSSGAIEQDATGVLMIHRRETFAPGKQDLKGLAEAYVRKSRNGETGVAYLKFRSAWTMFTDEGPADEFDKPPEED